MLSTVLKLQFILVSFSRTTQTSWVWILKLFLKPFLVKDVSWNPPIAAAGIRTVSGRSNLSWYWWWHYDNSGMHFSRQHRRLYCECPHGFWSLFWMVEALFSISLSRRILFSIVFQEKFIHCFDDHTFHVVNSMIWLIEMHGIGERCAYIPADVGTMEVKTFS